VADPLTPAQVLAALPQREPFRFVDEILELDDEHIVATFRFREDADFYRGHFPGNPVTPGVLLLEAMAQAGVAAHGIHLLAREAPDALEGGRVVTLFTEAQIEFVSLVPPGARVVVTGRKLWFRRRKLRSRVEARLDDGTLVALAELAGLATTS
jgi:3-hydroxyacyl-[acyl-carrier-protein] dehydratase